MAKSCRWDLVPAAVGYVVSAISEPVLKGAEA
jgi:hypothetical protein